MLLDRIKAATQLIAIEGERGRFELRPPVRLKSMITQSIFHAVKLDESIPKIPLLYMQETRSWWNIGAFELG